MKKCIGKVNITSKLLRSDLKTKTHLLEKIRVTCEEHNYFYLYNLHKLNLSDYKNSNANKSNETPKPHIKQISTRPGYKSRWFYLALVCITNLIKFPRFLPPDIFL